MVPMYIEWNRPLMGGDSKENTEKILSLSNGDRLVITG